MFRSTRRLSSTLRVFVLGLLAIGLAMKPVLASLVDLHELTHELAATPAHAEHGEHAPHVAQAAQAAQIELDESPQDSDWSDALHALIHVANCCGQSPLASSSAIAFTVVSASVKVLPIPDSPILPQAASLAPFRPPIAA